MKTSRNALAAVLFAACAAAADAGKGGVEGERAVSVMADCSFRGWGAGLARPSSTVAPGRAFLIAASNTSPLISFSVICQSL